LVVEVDRYVLCRQLCVLSALRFISLTCATLVLGLTLAHVLEAPGKRHLTGAEWVAVQNTFYAGFAVVGGIGEVLGLLSSSALVAVLRGRRCPQRRRGTRLPRNTPELRVR
jgi:hypothetical protein